MTITKNTEGRFNIECGQEELEEMHLWSMKFAKETLQHHREKEGRLKEYSNLFK